MMLALVGMPFAVEHILDALLLPRYLSSLEICNHLNRKYLPEPIKATLIDILTVENETRD